jgi:hypothetical protein
LTYISQVSANKTRGSRVLKQKKNQRKYTVGRREYLSKTSSESTAQEDFDEGNIRTGLEISHGGLMMETGKNANYSCGG